ncbi:MAG: hypothetical protein M4579_000388 [Chaenotheca gracillima]|nr:MAG: hypothetical protein M4579_000388 [Chaenotheca gracillima]
MDFGAGEAITAIEILYKVYKKVRDAPGEIEEIMAEIGPTKIKLEFINEQMKLRERLQQKQHAGLKQLLVQTNQNLKGDLQHVTKLTRKWTDLTWFDKALFIAIDLPALKGLHQKIKGHRVEIQDILINIQFGSDAERAAERKEERAKEAKRRRQEDKERAEIKKMLEKVVSQQAKESVAKAACDNDTSSWTVLEKELMKLKPGMSSEDAKKILSPVKDQIRTRSGSDHPRPLTEHPNPTIKTPDSGPAKKDLPKVQTSKPKPDTKDGKNQRKPARSPKREDGAAPDAPSENKANGQKSGQEVKHQEEGEAPKKPAKKKEPPKDDKVAGTPSKEKQRPPAPKPAKKPEAKGDTFLKPPDQGLKRNKSDASKRNSKDEAPSAKPRSQSTPDIKDVQGSAQGQADGGDKKKKSPSPSAYPKEKKEDENRGRSKSPASTAEGPLDTNAAVLKLPIAVRESRSRSARSSERRPLPKRTGSDRNILCVDLMNGGESDEPYRVFDPADGIVALPAAAQTYLELVRLWTANVTGEWLFNRVESAGCRVSSDLLKLSGSTGIPAGEPALGRERTNQAITDLAGTRSYFETKDAPWEKSRVVDRMRQQKRQGLNAGDFSEYDFILCFCRRSYNTVNSLQAFDSSNAGGATKKTPGDKQGNEEAKIIFLDVATNDVPPNNSARPGTPLPYNSGIDCTALKKVVQDFLFRELGWQRPPKKICSGPYRTLQFVVEPKEVKEGSETSDQLGNIQGQFNWIERKSGCHTVKAAAMQPSKGVLVSIVGKDISVLEKARGMLKRS